MRIRIRRREKSLRNRQSLRGQNLQEEENAAVKGTDTGEAEVMRGSVPKSPADSGHVSDGLGTVLRGKTQGCGGTDHRSRRRSAGTVRIYAEGAFERGNIQTAGGRCTHRILYFRRSGQFCGSGYIGKYLLNSYYSFSALIYHAESAVKESYDVAAYLL